MKKAAFALDLWPTCRGSTIASVAVFACSFFALLGLAVAQDRQNQVTSEVVASQPEDQSASESDARSRSEADLSSTASISFSFERAPWRDVIQWIAEECGLALHYEDLPTGSFSYTDPKDFTPDEAIDRVNLFLLPQGYTLVQSGSLLSVINLGDPRSKQTLDSLARFVKADQLQELPPHDVVKCIFPLGELEPDEAVQELSVLQLMTTPSPLEKTNQLMITDTASNLRNVKSILDAFQPDTLDNGTVMKNFVLQHVDAEDILTVARPHLGLATGEMIGIDVSISSDLQGKNIFVTGVEDKVKLIEGLVKDLDTPKQSLASGDSEAVLQAHPVPGGNLDVVYNVLQTLLAGQSLRLSTDEAAGSIVALASPRIQKEIAATVEQLQASEADFEVIPLKTADPYFVISLLEGMLDLPGEFDDPDEIDPDAPRIDADPANRRLFVRAKPKRIEQIKKIVAGLDEGASAEQGDDTMRLLPLRAPQAKQYLQIAARFWNRDNPIFYLPPASRSSLRPVEKTIHAPEVGSKRRDRLTSITAGADSTIDLQVLTDGSGEGPAIRCQMTSRGLLLQSEDTEALDRLEAHLRTIVGPGEASTSPPTVYYLKYVKPADALKMLSELLEGGQSAEDAVTESLVNGLVSSSGDYYGTFLTTRDGLMTLMADTLTVVADARLNRLIAQGTAEDIRHVEEYLRIIDKDRGLTFVETYGTSHVIELLYTDAEEVAEAVRAAYAGRVASGGSNAPQAARGGGGRPENNKPERGNEDERGRGEEDEKARPRGGSQPVQNMEPVMTVAVHAASNSLIVTAPDQLFEQVKALVETIDQRSQETVEFVTPGNTALLEMMFGEGESASGRSSERRDSRRSPSRSDEGSERFRNMLRERFGR